MLKTELKGRLGNQMFQYAILRIMADKINTSYSFDKNWLGKNIFDIEYGSNELFKKINTFDEGKNAFNKNVFDIKDNTLLRGYWQSPKYFEGYDDFVKDLFKIKESSLPKNLPEMDDNTCIIHFRGGDYLSHNYVPKKEWYEKARKEALSFNPNMKFLVITDDPITAKIYLPNDKIVSSTLINDFTLLLNAKNKIISSSTFSWWAYWLSENESIITIAPDNWLNHNGVKKVEGFYPFDIKTEGIKYIK